MFTQFFYTSECVTLHYVLIKDSRIKEKWQCWKSLPEKHQVYYKENNVIIKAGISLSKSIFIIQHLDYAFFFPEKLIYNTPTRLYLFYRNQTETKLHSQLYIGASLVVQWLRIHLPMQGIHIQPLVWEDSICYRVSKPRPLSRRSRACKPQLLKLTHLQPVLHNKRSHHNDKPSHYNEKYPCLLHLEKARVQQQRQPKI